MKEVSTPQNIHQCSADEIKDYLPKSKDKKISGNKFTGDFAANKTAYFAAGAFCALSLACKSAISASSPPGLFLIKEVYSLRAD